MREKETHETQFIQFIQFTHHLPQSAQMNYSPYDHQHIDAFIPNIPSIVHFREL